MGKVAKSVQRPVPLEVAERLGPYYVYALVDPRDAQIFYVGKGTGSRLAAHGRQADLAPEAAVSSAKVASSAKVKRIRAIRRAGLEPCVDIVRHGLSEHEALLVEAALIDVLDGLTNVAAGHGARDGRQPLSELIARNGATDVPEDAPPAVLIRLSRWRERDEEIEPGVRRHCTGYRPGITDQELVDGARAWWRISPSRIDREGIRYAVAVHEGITRAVMTIGDWTERSDGRRAFAAEVVTSGPVFEAWIGPTGRHVPFVTAAQNPIIYWPLRSVRRC
jgi:hypothetical protein